MNIKIDLQNARVSRIHNHKTEQKAEKIFWELRKNREEYTGWANWPVEFPDTLFGEIEKEAKKIRENCEVLIVVGIGGSYLGTAAVVQAIAQRKQGCPYILFAGNSLSGEKLARAIEIAKEKEICMCVVSKSGETLETKIAYKTIRKIMENKYGSLAKERIIAITDAEKGSLRTDINEQGYINFEIPRNIGGRYSAFTPAILFPLAVEGIDIRNFVKGARDIARDSKFWKEEGIKYAATRFLLNKSGKDIEVFEFFEPSLQLLGEWCKQLFGESEGKEKKGLFPAMLILSTDLHSMGQYLQEGKPVFFETIINIENAKYDVVLPECAGENIAGVSLNKINQIAVDGVIAAHSKAGTPIIKIELKDRGEYSIGQFLYFMMMTAGITGKLMGVDPFTQSGVEQYKSEIRQKLGEAEGIK